MKRNLLGLAAVLLTIAVSSFTTRVDYFYFIYSGSGAEKNINNYADQSAQPSHSYNALSPQKLNWFRIEDVDVSGDIDVSEFNSAFEAYDQVDTGSDLLRDEAADITGELDLENKP